MLSTFWFTEQAGFHDTARGDRPTEFCPIGSIRGRAQVVVTGTICSTRVSSIGTGPAYRAKLEDGTGQLDLVFLGRRSVPGVVVGSRCTVAGTVIVSRRHFELWNPFYRLEPAGPS